MAGVNKVILVGNVGKDPEMRNTKDGKKIATFSLATSESWKDKNTGERKETTEWHRIVVFNENIAGVVEKYVHKGSKLYIEGSQKTRKWTDNDGIERYTTETVVAAFHGQLALLDSRKGPGTAESEEEYGADTSFGKSEPPKELDDEIPF